MKKLPHQFKIFLREISIFGGIHSVWGKFEWQKSIFQGKIFFSWEKSLIFVFGANFILGGFFQFGEFCVWKS